MNKNLLIGIVVIVVLVVGYVVISKKPSQPVPQPITTIETPTPEEITVVLSQQNDSGESGTAILMEVDGKVKVTLSLAGAPPDVAQPAHIHMGSCPNVGEVKYSLISPENGISETVLDVTLAQLKSELPLGINVHKSEKEASVYVSCGNITL